MMCKRPDVPLQDELLTLTIQLRISQPSILAWIGVLTQVSDTLHIPVSYTHLRAHETDSYLVPVPSYRGVLVKLSLPTLVGWRMDS